jgi:hypothetical protein
MHYYWYALLSVLRWTRKFERRYKIFPMSSRLNFDTKRSFKCWWKNTKQSLLLRATLIILFFVEMRVCCCRVLRREQILIPVKFVNLEFITIIFTILQILTLSFLHKILNLWKYFKFIIFVLHPTSPEGIEYGKGKVHPRTGHECSEGE